MKDSNNPSDPTFSENKSHASSENGIESNFDAEKTTSLVEDDIFGENRLQELEKRVEICRPDVWSMITSRELVHMTLEELQEEKRILKRHLKNFDAVFSALFRIQVLSRVKL